MHAFVLFLFTQRSFFFVSSAAACELGKPSFYARDRDLVAAKGRWSQQLGS